MKVTEFRDSASTSCGSARRISTTSCSGCGSRSRWASSRRRQDEGAPPRSGAPQDGAAGEGDGLAMATKVESRRRRQRQDGQERGGGGRAPGARRALRQDAEAHHEVHGARREERGEGRRSGGDRRGPAAQPPQALGRHPRRREGEAAGDHHDPDAIDLDVADNSGARKISVINPSADRPGATLGSATSSPPR